MPVAPEEVITAPLAGRKWLEARGLRPHLLIHPDLAADFREMECVNPDAVFLGDAGEYVKIAGTGKNNLDFHIAYYIAHELLGGSKDNFHQRFQDNGFGLFGRLLEGH